MATRFLFVRHAESAHTARGVLGGPKGCSGLTPRGLAQSIALAGRLAGQVQGPVSLYSSTLPRAVDTATEIAKVLRVEVNQDCGLCTWHVPAEADGVRLADFRKKHALPGGGVHRPFERGSETWAELVTRTSRSIVDLADRHRGTTIVVVAHAETVESSFTALGAQPLHRAFDLRVDPASVTEWTTEENPTAWPPPRWTLVRFNDTR